MPGGQQDNKKEDTKDETRENGLKEQRTGVGHYSRRDGATKRRAAGLKEPARATGGRERGRYRRKKTSGGQ